MVLVSTDNNLLLVYLMAQLLSIYCIKLKVCYTKFIFWCIYVNKEIVEIKNCYHEQKKPLQLTKKLLQL